MTSTPLEYVNAWGATVGDVTALVPQVGIEDLPLTPDDPVDDVYGGEAPGKVTKQSVEAWIRDVDSRVTVRLHRFKRLAEGVQADALRAHAKGLVALGAASYLVSAAHPSKAGINDQTNYSGELWAKFLEGLEELATLLDSIIDDGGEEILPPVYKVRPASNFQRPVFPDRQRW